VWLVGEWRDDGERKYYVTNHPPATPLRTLVRAIKRRWVCEQAHQQMKEELGLDHFEGRSWIGLHHHALLSMIAFAFLQHLRLRAVSERGKNRPVPSRSASPALAPRDPPRLPRDGHARAAASMSGVPRAPRRDPSRVEVAE
jgi:SRSO17 transposase